MEKHELLDKVSASKSFIKSFLDEYREGVLYENEEVLTSLLSEIINDITIDAVPNSLYDRISKLIDTLNIEKLKTRHLSLQGNHDFEKYKQICDSIIANSFLVRRTFHLLKAIGFTNSNVVLIGANGSGKTTFANSIREFLEKTNNGIVIPAQKILIFPTYSYIPTYNSAFSTYESHQKEVLDDKQTYDAGKSDDIPYDLTRRYGAEMKILVSALIGERIAQRDNYCSIIHDGDAVDTTKFRSKLDDVIDIWNSLIEHRKLFCDNSGNLQIMNGEEKYPAYRMGDGEREIFYVVGRVLLAKEKSLIVVDEPELHLHKAILNKLWDTLEQKRSDCMFIYLTHDIDFASTRVATKCWLKSYSQETIKDWEIEPIIDNEIPEALLMMILGSRKRILFCEGKSNSMDCLIFEYLFPSYTVVPVASCKDVINYTKAFNKVNDKYADAFGIIDRDFRTQEQLEILVTEKIYSYKAAEIENLFLVEDFITGFSSYKKESCNINDIKSKVIEKLQQNILQQASFYVTQKINYYFNETHLKNGKTEDEVRTSFSNFINQVRIDDWFKERILELNSIVMSNNYSEAILVYNNKGLHSIIEKALGISSYNKKALEYMKVSEGAKEVLRKLFPQELFM